MARTLPRSLLVGLGLALVGALSVIVFLNRGDEPGGNGTAVPDTATTAPDATAEPGAVAEAAGDLPDHDATTSGEADPDRSRVAPETVVHGRFVAPRGSWPGGGVAELAEYVPPPPGGMFGMVQIGLDAARPGASDPGPSFAAFLGRAPAIATTRIGADGQYRFDDPPPGEYVVRLGHVTLRVAGAPRVDVVAGDSTEVPDIATAPAAGILVLVADTDGRPVEDANVELGSEIDPSRFSDPSKLGDLGSLLKDLIPHERRTDERGVARFDGFEASGQYVLKVRAKDHVEHRRKLVVVAGRENVVKVELLAGATLSARVLGPDGEPRARARVELTYPEQRRPTQVGVGAMGVRKADEVVSYEIACDENGRIERRGLPAGRAELKARTPGFKRTSQALAFELDETTSATVHLETGVTITGRVTDENGLPLPVAWVLNVPMLGQDIMGFDLGDMMGADVLSIGAEERGVPCDEDGKFVLGGFDEGNIAQLIATANGYDPAVANDVTAGAVDVELRLPTHCTVTGRVVVDDTGDAPTSFKVELRKRAFMVMDRRMAGETFSSADGGRFTLAPCPREKLEFVVEAAGFARASRKVDLTEGSIDVGEIRLLAPAAIEGVVIGPNSEPLEGATLRVSKGGMFDSKMMAQMVGVQLIETDAEGRFRVENLAGRAVRLIAEYDGLAPTKSNAVRIAAGETVTGVVIQLSQGGEIRGVLLDADEQPLAGWRAQASHASGSSIDMSETAADGSFAFTGLQGGTYKVDAIMMDELEGGMTGPRDFEEQFDFGKLMSQVLERIVSDRVVVREGEVSELTLIYERPIDTGSGGCEIEGTVRVGGEPLGEGAVLWLTPGTAVPRHIADVRDGRFTVRGVRPGTWRVQLQAGLFSGTLGRAQTVQVPESPSYAVALEMPGGRIAGQVLSASDHRPVDGCVVALMRPNAAFAGTVERFDLGEGTILTDENGRFDFVGLEPGDYEITAKQVFSGSGLSGRLPSVQLGAGQARDDLEVVLEEGGTLRVAVRDADGGVRANALVTVLGEQGSPLDLFHRTLTDVDGVVAFQGLPDGRYRVAVDAPAAAPTISAPTEVHKGGTSEVTVALDRGRPVTVALTGGVPEDLRGQLVLYAIWRSDGVLVRTGRFVLPDTDATSASLNIGRFSPGEYRARLESPRLGIVEVQRRVPQRADAIWPLDLRR